MIGTTSAQQQPVGKLFVSFRRICPVILATLVVMGGACTPALAGPIPIELIALDATVFPFGNPGGTFPVTDVDNFFGQGAGAPLGLRVDSVTLLTGSGANTGTIDLVGGLFSLNWGFFANVSVLNTAGNQVGSAEVRGVLPETGVFDSLTMTGTSETSDFVPSVMDLFSAADSSKKNNCHYQDQE